MSHDAKKYASYFASDLARAFGAVTKSSKDMNEEYSSEFQTASSEQNNNYGHKKASVDRGFVQHGIYF